MKHYNPDLENKILADLTPRRTGTDHGFLSFVKADASTDAVAGVEVVESNHIWIDTASDEEIIYEAADIVLSQFSYGQKITNFSASAWQRDGTGNITQVSTNYSRRFTRATGYIAENIAANATYSGALGTIPNGPNMGDAQVVTPTADFVDTGGSGDSTPFHFAPVSCLGSLQKEQFSLTEKMGCVAVDYDTTSGVDNFTWNHDPTKAYIPRATVIIQVTVGVSTSTFAAPVVATGEWYSSATDRYQMLFYFAEPILTGRMYSTPGVNGGADYVYNPNSGRSDADILSNIYPVSVTTNAAGDLVDAGIYDFGFAYTDTLTSFIQIMQGVDPDVNVGIGVRDAIQDGGRGFFAGILPGVSSLYYGDQTNDSIVTEMVTGTSLGFFTDVEIQGGGMTADGDITTEGSVNAEGLDIAGLLTVLPRQIYSKNFLSPTTQAVSEDVNTASLSFTGPMRFPEEGGAPGVYFTTVDEDADYYFVAATGGLTFGLLQVFKYSPSPGNFSVTSSISLGLAHTNTYSISNPDAIQKLKAASLTTLKADPTLNRMWDGQVLFELDDDDFEDITTGNLNDFAANQWALSIEPGESRDVLVDQDLNIGGTLTIEGGIVANGPICAPFDVDHLSSAATLVKCGLTYITSSDTDPADRLFTFPEGEIGDWVKIVIRAGRTDANPYRFTPFLGDSFETTLNEPLVIQPGNNTAIELTYISSAVGWAITSAS